MSQETNLEFYVRRHKEELEKASSAESEEAASAHRMLADIYHSEIVSPSYFSANIAV